MALLPSSDRMARASARLARYVAQGVCACLALAGGVAAIFFIFHHGDLGGIFGGSCPSNYSSPRNTNLDLPSAPDASGDFTLQSFFDVSMSSSPVAVAFSGGGWKAMAQHIGTVRALVDAGITLPGVATGNSGGSWFLSLWAYSEKFWTSVQRPAVGDSGEEARRAYDEFMHAYTTGVQPPSKADLDRLARILAKENMTSVVEAIQAIDGIKIALYYGLSWLNFISAMLDAYDPGLSSKTVGPPLNSNLTGVELGFQTSLFPGAYQGWSKRKATSSEVDEKEGSYGGDGDGLDFGGLTEGIGQYVGQGVDDLLDDHATTISLVAQREAFLVAPVPVAYYVDGLTGTPSLDTGLVGGGGWTDGTVVRDLQVAESDSNTDSAGSSGRIQPVANALPKVPNTVGVIASSSSAAAGIAGSPVLIDQILAGNCSHQTADALVAKDIFPLAGLENMGICADGSATTCAFPAGRMGDGGYTDNAAVVTALVALQRKYPDASKPYRIFASFSNSCTGPLTLDNCNNYDNSIERLFANPPVARSGARYPSTPTEPYESTVRGPTPTGTVSYSQQVFAEGSPDWQAHGPSVYRTLVVNVTTVDNAYFGVRGGDSVSLFIVYGNVGPTCPTVIFPAGSEDQVAACSDLAAGMSTFLSRMGSSDRVVDRFVTGFIESPAP